MIDSNCHLFATYRLSDVLREQMRKALEEVETTAEDYLLNVSESEFPAYVISKYQITAPQFGEAYRTDPHDVNISTGGDPRWGGLTTVKGFRIEIRLPFTGDSILFRCQPSTYTTCPPRAYIHAPEPQEQYLELAFDYTGELNPNRINGDFDRVKGEIEQYLTWTRQESSQFNSELSKLVPQCFANRKQGLLNRRNAAAAIKVALIRRQDTSGTYALPNVQRKAVIQKPVVTEKGFTPEPILLEHEYEHILQIIRSMVSVMERSPKAFIHMGEEDLRSHFLVQLNGQYQGRATGETFNFQGKTDILIREQDRNVFISECKIWKGEAELLKGVDQILGYLHWRDTKTALLIFNRNKSFSEVLAKVSSTVQGHVCCKRLIKQISETEWRFLFRNPDDANRELQLAVLCFDVPKEAS